MAVRQVRIQDEVYRYFKMKVRLFPDGRIHSAYLDMVKHPPEGVEYVGDFEFSPGTSYDMNNKDIVRKVLDVVEFPYLFNIDCASSMRSVSHPQGCDTSDCLIHSCQKLLWTKSDFVVDIEHGNPFMGAYHVHKYRYPQFRRIVDKILSADNCKAILPWSGTAAVSFMLNFMFLRGGVFDKIRVINPAVEYVGEKKKFSEFTFMFVAGGSFYAKGGLQTLQAFELLRRDFGDDVHLIMMGEIPDEIYTRYGHINGLHLMGRMPREKLLNTLSHSHCLVLPSHADTFGMTVLEAKARGVPTIMADSFAADEVVTHGHTGYLVGVDRNVDLRFDNYGRKRMGKGEFHRQFDNYVPDALHVTEIMNAMDAMIYCHDRLGKNCLEEIQRGKFSINVRNKALKEVYEGE